MFEIEPMPQPVQECMLFLAFMSFSVIVCLYQHINVLHEKAKVHDDFRLTVFVTLPTDSESAAFNARNTVRTQLAAGLVKSSYHKKRIASASSSGSVIFKNACSMSAIQAIRLNLKRNRTP